MSLLSKKKLLVFVVIFVMSLFLSHPTFATDSSTVVETTFFGNINDEGDGCGVFTILNLVVDILSIGVGILGVIGISVAGIQYLTSAGKEDQARRSRVRIFQIIIGLAVYAIMYTGINWLTPGGKLNTGSSCSTLTNEQLAKMKAAEQKASSNTSSNKSSNKSTNKSNAKGDPTCLKKAAKVVKNAGICNEKTGAERIAKTAELLSQPTKEKSRNKNSISYGPTSWKKLIAKGKGQPSKVFMDAYDEVRHSHWKRGGGRMNSPIRLGASCDVFVATVITSSGYDKAGGFSHGKLEAPIKKHTSQWKIIKSGNSPKRGDICHKYFGNGGAHIKIYLGNGKISEANSGLSSGDKRWGGIMKGNCKGYTIYRAIK